MTLEESLGQPLPEAYETLLEDILDSDQSLFIRADEIETMWEKVEPLISSADNPRVYPRGKLPDFRHRVYTEGMGEVGSFDGEKAFKAICQTDKNLSEE
jgi:glucose-6-phosphate 1-dehydrogenase